MSAEPKAKLVVVNQHPGEPHVALKSEKGHESVQG